jgi:hypothetical protein
MGGGLSVHRLKLSVQKWMRELFPELLADELARRKELESK